MKNCQQLPCNHLFVPIIVWSVKQILEDLSMSDLAATNCGCAEERCGCGCDNGCGNSCGNSCQNNCGCGFGLGNFGGNNSCSCILWIIILFSLCGNNGCGNNGMGFGNNGDCCWIIIVLLLLCGNGCGCGC